MPDIDLTDYTDTVAAFAGNEQRAMVYLDRYSRKDGDGKPTEPTPNQMWGRVAIAMSDQSTVDEASGQTFLSAPDYKEFFDLLSDFKFVPGGRILAGAGTESQVTYYNCYVIPLETKARRRNRQPANILQWESAETSGEYRMPPLEVDNGADSREAIFDTIGLMVDIMSRGGGVGINWSVLRPAGNHLKRINGTTSGPVSWMDVASKAVGTVEQGGSRRGAAMFMIDDWHPDVLEFIDAKRDMGKITNANVSVCVSDTLMWRVQNDGDWHFGFPDTTDPHYDSEWDGDATGWLAKGYGWVEGKSIKARELWRKMAEAAWASGEPGVVFLDRYNKMSTGQGVERIISVNPCGEQGLGPYSVCNLGAMNLAAYVVAPVDGGVVGFDRTNFERDVATAVKFLDRVIDETYYFIPENEAIQKNLRRIGLGVMGLADALILQGIRYGSPEAIEFTEMVFRSMKDVAIETSAELAAKLGAAPAWRDDMWKRPYLADYVERHGLVGLGLPAEGMPARLRNIFLLTQAPTGTTSILAGVNSGIEPYFAFEYTRKDRTGTHKISASIVNDYRMAHPLDKMPDWFVTSNDVTVEEHVAMQAAAQKYIDSSVSKTINGPTAHTVEDVEKAYTLAYESGCKGVAYFRDGSGRDQVLYHDDPEFMVSPLGSPDKTRALIMGDEDLRSEVDRKEALIVSLQGRLHEVMPFAVEHKRGITLTGETRKVKTAAGTAYVTVNRDQDGRPIEVFVNVGKAGSDIMTLGEAIGRLASLSLRKGATLGGVANQLEGIGGNGKFNQPLAHAIGSALTEINLDGLVVAGSAEVLDPETWVPPRASTQTPKTQVSEGPTGDLCPDCQNFSVAFQENCAKCALCGWSKC